MQVSKNTFHIMIMIYWRIKKMDYRDFENFESGDVFDQIFCHPYLLSIMRKNCFFLHIFFFNSKSGNSKLHQICL